MQQAELVGRGCRDMQRNLIVELQHTKHTSGAPLVRNFDKPIWSKKFGSRVRVLPPAKLPVQTLEEGEGSHRAIAALVNVSLHL